MNLATPDAMFDALPSAPVPASDDQGQAQAPEASDPAAAPAEPAPAQPAEPALPEGTTPEPDDTATSSEPASAIDKGLEPLKDFLTNKGLDPKAPDFVPKVVQMAQEAETLIGRKATEVTLTQNRVDDLQRDLLTGGVDALNRLRESNGLPKLNVETRSHTDQIKEMSELISHINQALNKDPASMDWLDKNLTEKLNKLRLDEAVETRLGKTPADKAQTEFVQNATGNINKFVAANKDSIPHLDALLPLLGNGGLLASHGIDRAQMASSPERLAAWAKVGEAVWLMQPDSKNPGKTNLDSHIAAQVKAAMNAQRLAANQGRPGGAPGAKNSVGTQPQNGSPIQVGWSDFHS